MKKKYTKGFSFIELLVVISIISVLSVIGTTNYQGIQSKARDSARKSNLNNLATALEIYFQKNGSYIDGTPGVQGDCASADTATFYTGPNSIASYMADTNVPNDPLTGERYCYISVGDGASFRLFAKLENSSDPDGVTCGAIRYYSVSSQDLTSTCPP